jgi:hypothetical protein
VTNRLDAACVEIFHAPDDFSFPGGFDRFVFGVIQTLDQGASEVGAVRHREFERLLQKFGYSSAHENHYAPKIAGRRVPPRSGDLAE